MCHAWAQAFPAKDPRERTTYMFSYLDADEGRPSLEAMMEVYWQTMPEYQVGVLSPKPAYEIIILSALSPHVLWNLF